MIAWVRGLVGLEILEETVANVTADQPGAAPMIFTPDVETEDTEAPSIPSTSQTFAQGGFKGEAANPLPGRAFVHGELLSGGKETILASIRRHPEAPNHWQVRYRDPSGRQRPKNFARKSDADKYAAIVEAGISQCRDQGRHRNPLANQGLPAFDAWQHRSRLRSGLWASCGPTVGRDRA